MNLSFHLRDNMNRLLRSLVVCCTFVLSTSLFAGEVININNQQLKDLVKEGVLLIDIRREEEWRSTGIVDSSKTLTLFNSQGRAESTFVPGLQALADTKTPVILICRSGNRTRVASQLLIEQLGYETIYNVTHGINKWIGDGEKVVPYP
jgi:rhodanese-related sulfurtransferase